MFFGILFTKLQKKNEKNNMASNAHDHLLLQGIFSTGEKMDT